MSNPTSNFNWQMPTATDLVTDLPADFEVFGQAVATSMADLLGGTTDQVLAKNSNTDMDFKWVTSDDANAIQNTIVDAKGDLVAASAADTPARLAVGANNSLLTADSSQATGLKYAGLWTTFTPTISGITLGNGTKTGSYCQIADTTFFRVVVTFGSTTSITSNIDLTMPTTPVGYSTFDYFNTNAQAYDSSTTTFFPSTGNLAVSSTVVRLLLSKSNGTFVQSFDYISTEPFTWATGDTLSVHGSYRNS